MYRDFIKPAGDTVITLILLLTLFPVFLFLIIFLKKQGKVFFIQERVGYKEKKFKILKFRTMTHEKNEKGELLPDIQRVTKTGFFLRKYSLDELPQLLNVLKGEMSLIGPRPLLPEYLSIYNDFQQRRHEVRPGITGLAQIKGRNALTWENRLKWDVEYVEKQSLKLDLKILFLTVQKLFTDSSLHGDLISEKFSGNE